MMLYCAVILGATVIFISAASATNGDHQRVPAQEGEDDLVPSTAFGSHSGSDAGAVLSACRNSRSRWLVPRRINGDAAAAADEEDGAGRLEMAGCLRDLLAASHRKLSTGAGLPSLGMPPVEPLSVGSATVADSTVLTGTIRNVRIAGLSEMFRAKNIRVRPPQDGSNSRIAVVRMRTQKGLRIWGDFEAVAHILKSVMPFYSGPESKISGIFDTSVDDALLTVRARYEDDPEKGAILDGVKLSLKFKGPRVQLKNEKLLPSAVLILLNQLLEDEDLSRTVINEVAPQVLEQFEEPVFNLLDNGFDKPQEILSR